MRKTHKKNHKKHKLRGGSISNAIRRLIGRRSARVVPIVNLIEPEPHPANGLLRQIIYNEMTDNEMIALRLTANEIARVRTAHIRAVQLIDDINRRMAERERRERLIPTTARTGSISNNEENEENL